MGNQREVKKSTKEQETSPLLRMRHSVPIKTTERREVRKAVPKKTEEETTKVITGARIVKREGGEAVEGSLSLSNKREWKVEVAGGHVNYSGFQAAPYARLLTGWQTTNPHVNLNTKIGFAYTGFEDAGNIYTSMHLGTSLRFNAGKADIRIAAALTPSASLNPIYLEGQWGAGLSIGLGKLRPYFVFGGSLVTDSAVHADLEDYLVPRTRIGMVGFQYKFDPGKTLVAETEFTPFYHGGKASFRWKGRSWSLGLEIGARKWDDNLFAGKFDPVFGFTFSRDWDFGTNIVKGRTEVDVRGVTLDVPKKPVKGEDYTLGDAKFSDFYSDELYGKRTREFREKLKALEEELYPKIQELLKQYTEGKISWREYDHKIDELTEPYFELRKSFPYSDISLGMPEPMFNFLTNLETANNIEELANAARGATPLQKILLASLLAEKMKSYTYDHDYDALGRAREVTGKNAEDFYIDFKKAVETRKNNPTTSCSEIHHTTAELLRKMGIDAYTISAVSKGYTWHVITLALVKGSKNKNENGLYLIDYGDRYHTKKFDLSLLMRSYAQEKGYPIWASYLFTGDRYVGTWESPQKKLMEGVIKINHYDELLSGGLGIDRGVIWP